MEKTIAQKLEDLVTLQSIDSQMDEIKKVRGALPDEVADLEDEIAGYQTRVDKFKGELKDLEANISDHRIQIAEKRIKEAYAKIELKNEEIEKTNEELSERSKDLENKKAELEVLTKESEADEKKLTASRKRSSGKIEDRLLNSYNKLRGNARNGLAVVAVSRSACGGCFNVIPPQTQAEIREKRKIIVCEHCGRILADVADEIVKEVEKPKRSRRKTTA